jgi:penicillin-insensitive murein endopeptidase
MPDSRTLALLSPLVLAVASGCARVPSPVAPSVSGSIGMPHRGVLTEAVELPKDAEGIAWLTGNDRHWGAPRFVSAIERAAKKVARERPGAPLVMGDMSRKIGGPISSHMSHRTGHDVDLLLFVTTTDGASVKTPGWVRVGADGLAWDDVHHRFLRLDVAREWLLVKTLVEDDDARVEWLFVSRPVRAMLLEWAIARGEPTETVLRAERLMLQPSPPAQEHDDHIHVRSTCDADEMLHGCEPTGPEREWLAIAPRSVSSDDDLAIARSMFREIGAGVPTNVPSGPSNEGPQPNAMLESTP